MIGAAMIGRGANRRGQPLLVLAAVLVGWLGVRLLAWEPPFDLAAGGGSLPTRPPLPFADPSGPAARARDGGEPTGPSREPDVDPPFWREPGRPLPGLLAQPVAAGRTAAGGPALSGRQPFPGRKRPPASGEAETGIADLAVGHTLLSMLGLSQSQVPAAIAALFDLRRAAPGRERELPEGLAQDAAPLEPLAPVRVVVGDNPVRRWSSDAWVLVREGGARAALPNQPSYGRSQAGAVLRYRLAPNSGHAPQAYARASAALSSPRDAELAAGLSARPLPGVPLRLAGEVRVADTQGRTDVRPTAYAVTELPPFELPLGLRGEFYAQGGYVGGDFATPFVDGQLRVSRDVARVGDAALSLGGGVWGGAQEGATRLDVGPSAAITFPVGRVYARLSVDYRVRVAGDAAPASGPALTLAAGF